MKVIFNKNISSNNSLCSLGDNLDKYVKSEMKVKFRKLV
jgi:hypothetical protein